MDRNTKEPLANYLLTDVGKFKPIGPVLKWAGGKGQLLSQMAPLFPKKIANYHEPFLGGAAVFFYIAPRYGAKSFLSDAVPDLINFYKVLKFKPRELLGVLKEVNDQYKNADISEKENIFYRLRGLDRNTDYETLDEVKKAARFYFLNKTAFNGLHRTNSSGLFNVPWGKYENPALFLPTEFTDAAEILNLFAEKIEVRDFEVVLQNAVAGDFVYFDPPYVPLSLTANFTTYSANGFSLKDHARLRSVCDELTRRNVMFMLSNSDVPFIHNEFRLYPTRTLSARRNINANGEKRGRVNELVVTNY